MCVVVFLDVTWLRREVIPLSSTIVRAKRVCVRVLSWADRASESLRQDSLEENNGVLNPLTDRFEVDSFLYGREGGKGELGNSPRMGIVGRLPPHAGRAGHASDCSSPFLGPSPWWCLAPCHSLVDRGTLYASRLGQKSFFLVFYPVASAAIPRDGRFRAGGHGTAEWDALGDNFLLPPSGRLGRGRFASCPTTPPASRAPGR